MLDKVYLENFESRITDELLRLCKQYGVLDGTLLATDDITARWDALAPEYMADAVSQINSYPAYTLALAGYIGMAVARGWDEDWERSCPFIYRALCGPQGFDYGDEHILQSVLGYSLESNEALLRESALRACAHTAMSQIRHEEVEGQTSKALYILARSARAMFRAGLSIELHARGYRYQRMIVDLPQNPAEQAN